MKTSNQFLPIARKLSVFLADDDKEDCLLFKDALEELPVKATLTTFENGELLMEQLSTKSGTLPDVLFLDLNMPRKNGFVTLGEIKRNTELDRLPVIIFSTALEVKKVNQVYRDAAHYYIRKPADFTELKKLIYEALVLITQKNNSLPALENFILNSDFKLSPSETKPSKKKSPGKTN